MKTLFSALLLFVGMTAFAQTEKTSLIDDSKFTCDKMEFNADQNKIVMTGNVSFKTDLLKLEHAESIVYRKDTKEILVSGLDEFTFDGTIKFSNPGTDKVMRYTLGESITYIE